MASPAYLKEHDVPRRPKDLVQHRLLAFAFGTPQNTWSFSRIADGQKDSIDFEPHLSINDYSEMASLLASGAGIGELPPMAQPELLRDGRLVEVMTQWRCEPVDVSIVHFGTRYVSRDVRIFKEMAAEVVPAILPKASAAR